jgi:hypothetical protein
MNKKGFSNFCKERISYFTRLDSLVSSLSLEKLYKITYVYTDYPGTKSKETNVLVGEIIAFNKDSIRVKVIAGDYSITGYGYKREFENMDPDSGYRTDTITIKYQSLSEPGASIEPLSKEDLPAFVGCKFQHKDFLKYLS